MMKWQTKLNTNDPSAVKLAIHVKGVANLKHKPRKTLYTYSLNSKFNLGLENVFGKFLTEGLYVYTQGATILGLISTIYTY